MYVLDYLQILWRRKLVIITTALFALATVVAGKVMIPPTYTTTATLRVLTATSGSSDYFDYELGYSDRIMNTYVEIATSSPILTTVLEELGIDTLPKITVEALPDTELLQITVRDTDSTLARNVANTLAEVLVNHRPVGGNRVYVVQPATPPEPPDVIDSLMHIALGLVVGLMGGGGLAFVFESLDTRLHTAGQIASTTNLPVLGEIPVAGRRKRKVLLATLYPYCEAFNRLGTGILAHTTPEAGPRTFLVTSAHPLEGKSTVVANLAASLAWTDKRVVVIDADLRRPTLHTHLALPNANGLSSLLRGETALSEAIRFAQSAGVHVITSGPTPPNPIALLGSGKMRVLLEELARQFDVVLLDSPAFLVVADTAALAPVVDSVIIVARRGSTQRKAVLDTRQQLAALNPLVLGVVINRAKPDAVHRYRRYYRPAHAGRAIGSQRTPGHSGAQRRDPLTYISGISLEYEKALNAAGIFTFEQLAAQAPETLAGRIDGDLTAGRARAERWIEQAQAIADRPDRDRPLTE